MDNVKIFKLLIAGLSAALFLLFACIAGCSNNSVASSPSIRVTSPAASIVVQAGTTCAIRWSVSGSLDNTVMIDLYSDTGIVASLAQSAQNSGSFSWLVSTDVPGDTTYRIKIQSAGQAAVSAFSGLFTIINNSDSYEPDSSPSNATRIGTNGDIQIHRISPPDTDWFAFEAAGGQSYCIQTHGNADTYLRLYATNALTLLAGNDDLGTGENALIVWTCASSGTYYFKVTMTSFSAGADYAIDVRAGNAMLILTGPASGIASLSSGSSLSITWASSINVGTSVSLFAFRNDSLACSIASGIFNNNGGYSWTIPWSLPTSDAYRIRIVSDNDTSIHDLSVLFGIRQIPSVLTLTSPTSATRWNTGASCSIYWTHSGNFGSYVKLALYDSTSYVATINANWSLEYGSCDWVIPNSLATSSAYRIRITSTADSSISDFSDPFTIIHVPTTLTITTPSAATTWNSGSSYSVYWTYTGNPGSYVTLALYDSTRLVSNFSGTYYLSSLSCTWPIPLSVQTSSTYRIRITSTADTSIYDFSDLFTITKVPTTLTLTTPSATTNWNTGMSYAIFWTYTGNPGTYVSLSLFDSTSQVSTITSVGSATSGTYTWTVPPTIASGNYRIKITSMQDTATYSFGSYFRITNIPTSITVTTPGKSNVWNVSSSYAIYWTYTGSVGTNVTVSLYNDTTFVQTINSYVTTANGTCSWSVPSSLPGGSVYRIKVASYTYPSIAGYSDYFTIMQVPARLTITTPGPATSWTTGSTCYVYWTYAGLPGTYVKLDLYDSSVFVRTISSSVSTSAGYLSWLVPTALHTSSQYQIKITSTSQDTVYNVSSFFTITNIPALVAVTAPAAGEVWYTGRTYYIYWNSSGPVPSSYVSVSLLDSTGASSSISSSVYRTNGYYAWSIPITHRGGTNMRIRVASTTDTSCAGYSGVFNVVPAPPQLTITSPDTSTSWSTGYSYTMYWSSVGSPGLNVKLDLYDTAGLVQSISQSVYTTNGYLLWSVPTSLKSGKYRVKITSTTMDTVYDYSTYFSIANASVNDSYEPDSTYLLAKPISAGAAAQNHTLSTGDKDWYSFSATAATSYTIETTGSTDTYLNLFSTDGVTLISSNDDGGTNTNAKLVWTCGPTGGTYYFKITGSFGSVGNYSVSVR